MTGDALTCCQAHDSRSILNQVLIPSFRTFLERDWYEHSIQTLADFVEGHYAQHLAERSGTRSGTWRRISRKDVEQALKVACAQTEEPSSIDAVVAQATEQGFDGEYVVSEIIIRETHRHTGLLHKEISKLRGSLPEVDPADLMGFAWRGLRVALRQYDPSRGFTFSTFACPKINGAIRDGIRSEHHLPKRLTTYARKLSSAEEHLTQALARTPTFADIAAYLDEASTSLELTTRLAAPASLEEMAESFGDGERELSCLVDTSNPEDHAVISSRRESVKEALEGLDPDARELIVMLFFDETTLTAAAGKLGVDVRTARAMRDSAMNSLRLDLAAWSPSTH